MPGKLKIFLGYAPGVGKAKVMVEEARRRKARGEDCIVAILSEEDRLIVNADLNSGLDYVQPLSFEYGGKTRSEINIPAILQRHPNTVLIDNLGHANVPGSAHAYRWQDAEEILHSGINVIATMNVESLESLNDDIFEITGKEVKDVVPDRMFHQADEVELVDLTPQALRNRVKRGEIVPTEQIDKALLGYFSEAVLNALREMAMREVARRVDEDLIAWRRQQRIARPWQTSDKILICISPTQSSLRVIRRGWRIGRKMQGEVRAVYVEEPKLPETSKKILEDDFKLCERLGIPTEILQGEPADAIIKYVQENNVSQIILGHSERTKIQEFLKGSLMLEIAKQLKTVDILVVAIDQRM
ncbi:MAG: universal stress protein [Armatimonadetes bacterium]|nr:sensor histidine kinase KdpD [Armatimonadota bacterium]MBS1701959.1 universal stress protein [Armatimonadota bacterium]MBS1728203.1 universal stress protein [Armatimonadota bacterium]